MAFFQKVRFVFQISKSPKKNIPNYYPELEIWICCLLLLVGNLNFKFRIVFWNISFWRFEKWIALSEKKPPLRAYCPNIYTVPDNSSNFFLGTIWILFNVGIVVANSVKQQVVPPGFLNFPNSILDVIVHTCQIHHLKHKVMPSL